VTWSSSANGTVTVDASGVATAVALGTATISATSEGVTGTATITVKPIPVASVAVSPLALSLTVGATGGLSASAKDAQGNLLTGRTVSWTSSATGVATVSDQGVVTAVSIGSSTITATIEGVSGSAAITVQPPAVASVQVTPATNTVEAGSTKQLTAVAKDLGGGTLNGRSFAWNSSNPAVAIVSGSGLVTAIAPGNATIAAVSEGVTGQAAITVTPAMVQAVAVSPPSASIIVSQTVALTATPQDALGNPLAGRAITWSTSNAGIATVSAVGVVTGVAGGTATITATSEGKSGSATIVVSSAPVATVTIQPGGGNLELGKAAALTAVLRDAGGNVLTGRQVTWSSSNLSIVNGYTQDDVAVVFGVAVGTATITASSEGKSASVQINVVAATGGNLCSLIAGASVYGDDGVFLGKLTNRFDSQSIYNEFGTYGSEFSSLSIYNRFGKYGSPYSALSAFNSLASRPPVLVKNGSALAYFTVNTLKTPYVHPGFAETCNF